MNTFASASDIIIPDEYFNRIKTGNDAFDTLLGDGLLPGSTLTLSAKHGTGKTQFCLQLLNTLANAGYKVGYVSNEESREQLAFTCKRIGTYNVPIANIEDLNDVTRLMNGLNVLVIDSFSKIKIENIRSYVKTEEVALKAIIEQAKANRCCTILITHNTKSGQSRGTSSLQHDVDATLYIEKLDDDPEVRRVYFDKNRFGSPTEICMRMTSVGYDLSLVESVESVEAEAAPKETKAQQLYKAALEFLENNGTSRAASVADAIGADYSRTMVVLRELACMGKVEKIGRGVEAVYKLADQPNFIQRVVSLIS